MQKKVLIVLLITANILATACKRHTSVEPTQPNQPSQPVDSNTTISKVSDSKYNSAIFILLREKEIYRFNIRPDSIKNRLTSWAQFSDSTNPDYYQYKVGSVLLNGFDFGSPLSRPGGQWQYYATWDMDSMPNLLDTPRFQVISPNGITDLNYATNNQLYYQDTMPRVIKRSQGLTIKVDPSVAPNTDSVWIGIEGIGADVYARVSVTAGTITFSPAQLAGLTPDSSRGHLLTITLARDHSMTNNAKGFFIGISRMVVWHVNVE